MRQLAFADPAAKARLEAILHPLIGQEAQRQAALRGGPPGGL
jgi:dephospho-CoA kinase